MAPNPTASTTLNISDGDDLHAALESAEADDTEIIVPAGNYSAGGGLDLTMANSLIRVEGGVAKVDHNDGDGGSLNITADGGDVEVRDLRYTDVGGDVKMRFFSESGDTIIADGIFWEGNTSHETAQGFYLDRTKHAGHAIYRNCFVTNMADNGWYVSSAGKGPSYDDGVIASCEIDNCFGLNNNITNFRLGGQGSVLRNSLSIHDREAPNDGGVEQRGVRLENLDSENLLVENNDIIQFKGGSFASDEGSVCFEFREATDVGGAMQDNRVYVGEDSAFLGFGETDEDVVQQWTNAGNHVTGEGDLNVPSEWEDGWCIGSGCTEPSNQWSVTGGGGGGGGSGWDNEIAFITEDRASGEDNITYSVTTNGEMAGIEISNKISSLDGGSLESNVTITQNSDGTYTAEGETGGGFGDAFGTNAQVVSFSMTGLGSDVASVEVNGDVITQDDLPYPPQEGDNQAPTAEFTITPAPATVGQTVTFDASGSDDPDGSIAGYEWSGAVSGTSQSVQSTFTSTGSKEVTLTVTDDAGATDSVTASVEVEPEPNDAPTARIDVSDNSPDVGQTVTFDGSRSSDPEGGSLTYDWTIGGQPYTGQSVTRSFASTGTYNATLTVTDAQGKRDTTSLSVSVQRSDIDQGGLTASQAALGLLGAGLVITGLKDDD